MEARSNSSLSHPMSSWSVSSQGQALYLLAMFDVWISYPLCGCFAMVSQLTNQISPYVLIFMSLERCVAVCFPFRHCTLVTLRNTFIIVFLIWTVASFNVLTQVLLLLEFPFHELPDLQMRVFCSTFSMHLGPKSYEYDTIYTYVLFTLSALVISCSFVGVMVVACLASGDRAQAEKTRYTLLLHLFQLGLNLLSMMQVKRLLDVVYVCVYVCVVLMPRCLSALTYGLRDPTLRPALGTHLCCSCGTGWEGLQHFHKLKDISLSKLFQINIAFSKQQSVTQ
uniref:G-protein coupled receptors family 1 profile domain-containing protein n=1 Tax=Neogobius melanostomus TaxID=47308 RepID=A0A8C6SNR1_9GOBI